MKKVLLILLLCFCTLSFTLTAEERVWEESYYKIYNADSFKNYKYASMVMDFENIHYALLNAAIFYTTNHMRNIHGRAPFKHAQSLEEAAFMHAKDMVRLDFFSHTNPLLLFVDESNANASNTHQAPSELVPGHQLKLINGETLTTRFVFEQTMIPAEI